MALLQALFLVGMTTATIVIVSLALVQPLGPFDGDQ